MPFSIIGSKVFDCQHGPDRKKAFKARQANEKVCFCSIKVTFCLCLLVCFLALCYFFLTTGWWSLFQKEEILPQDTMKFGCTASIRLSEVITYPSYKVNNDHYYYYFYYHFWSSYYLIKTCFGWTIIHRCPLQNNNQLHKSQLYSMNLVTHRKKQEKSTTVPVDPRAWKKNHIHGGIQ